MEKFIIMILSVLLSSLALNNFFVEYKEGRYLSASVEIIVAIVFIVSLACVMWHITLQDIA